MGDQMELGLVGKIPKAQSLGVPRVLGRSRGSRMTQRLVSLRWRAPNSVDEKDRRTTTALRSETCSDL